MGNLLSLEPVCYARCFMDTTEECGFNGDYTLPEYCPDIAVVLKCLSVPRLQSRQFSGDNLLLDGAVDLRVVYLDEGRGHIHSVEFSVPYSCTLHGSEESVTTPVFFDFSTKYVNCRATSPRRLEVHGAVQVCAQAYGNCDMQRAVPTQKDGLYTRNGTALTSKLVGSAEKIVTVSEVLEFPETLPAAEMLLGGSCKVLAKEWRVLSGKVIVRGALLIHQLYTDNTDTGTTHCLDFEVPFSQILDVAGVREGHLCRGDIQLLTDTERCSVGPDGGNTLLEVTAKLMIQVHMYESGELPLTLESYHTQYPVEQDFEECEYQAFCGCRNEQTVLPMQIELPEQQLQELVDVWMQPQNVTTVVENHTAIIGGTMLVSVLGRDREGEIAYFEKAEEFRVEFPCDGNEVKVKISVSELRYRAVDGKLEVQASLCIRLCVYHTTHAKTVSSLRLDTERPYVKTKASALLYYAQPGETLWEIGRECHTSPEMIQKENETVEDKVSVPCVLFVPIV